MKRSVIITFLALLFSATVYSQDWFDIGLKTSVYKDGSWLPWRQCHGVVMFGQYNNFTIAPHLSDNSHAFYIRVKIDNYFIPDKKTRKRHIKNKEWYEYSGYIEYWIDDDHPDFLSQMDSAAPITYLPDCTPFKTYDGRPRIIKKSKATIRIEPYKEKPSIYTTYNILFEGIAFAFFFYNKGY